MNQPVIDASLAIKWFLWEEGTEQAHSLLEQLTTFYVPDLFLVEIDSVLTKKARKGELKVDEAFQKRSVFRKLPYKMVSYNEVEEFAFRLATEFSITSYDAVYVAIAIDRDTTLYTADRRLSNGMATTPFSEHIESIEY